MIKLYRNTSDILQVVYDHTKNAREVIPKGTVMLEESYAKRIACMKEVKVEAPVKKAELPKNPPSPYEEFSAEVKEKYGKKRN